MVPGRQFGQFPTSILGSKPRVIALYCALHANTNLLTGQGSAPRASLMAESGITHVATFYECRKALTDLGVVTWWKPNGRATRWTLPPIPGVSVGDTLSVRQGTLRTYAGEHSARPLGDTTERGERKRGLDRAALAAEGQAQHVRTGYVDPAFFDTPLSERVYPGDEP